MFRRYRTNLDLLQYGAQHERVILEIALASGSTGNAIANFLTLPFESRKPLSVAFIERLQRRFSRKNERRRILSWLAAA